MRDTMHIYHSNSHKLVESRLLWKASGTNISNLARSMSFLDGDASTPPTQAEAIVEWKHRQEFLKAKHQKALDALTKREVAEAKWKSQLVRANAKRHLENEMEINEIDRKAKEARGLADSLHLQLYTANRRHKLEELQLASLCEAQVERFKHESAKAHDKADSTRAELVKHQERKPGYYADCDVLQLSVSASDSDFDIFGDQDNVDERSESHFGA